MLPATHDVCCQPHHPAPALEINHLFSVQYGWRVACHRFSAEAVRRGDRTAAALTQSSQRAGKAIALIEVKRHGNDSLPGSDGIHHLRWCDAGLRSGLAAAALRLSADAARRHTQTEVRKEHGSCAREPSGHAALKPSASIAGRERCAAMSILRYALMTLSFALFGSAGVLVAYDVYLAAQLRRLLRRSSSEAVQEQKSTDSRRRLWRLPSGLPRDAKLNPKPIGNP